MCTLYIHTNTFDLCFLYKTIVNSSHNTQQTNKQTIDKLNENWILQFLGGRCGGFLECFMESYERKTTTTTTVKSTCMIKNLKWLNFHCENGQRKTTINWLVCTPHMSVYVCLCFCVETAYLLGTGIDVTSASSSICIVD